MAARVLLLGILFTEVLEPLCAAGVKGPNNLHGKNGPKGEGVDLRFGKNSGLTLRIEPSGDILLGKRGTTLNCLANNITWLYNDEPAPPCGVTRCGLLDDGSLHFYKKQNLQLVQKSKGGTGSGTKPPEKHVYRCIGHTSGGSLRSSPITVQIAELGHTFRKSPNDLTIVEGEIARFTCLIDSVPFPPNITWQHNGEPVLTDHNNTKYFMVPPGVLYISATKSSDAGSYRCVATNDYIKKTKRSKEAKLTVVSRLETDKPRTAGLLYPQISYNHSLLSGSSLKIICAASGYPPPSIIWSFLPKYPDGSSTLQNRILLNSTTGISVLTLKNVSIYDAGTYLCSTKNAVSNGLEVQNITVDVSVPPTLIKKPVNQICPNGRTARFECQAQGTPPPEIYWLKDSENIAMNGRRTTYIKENNKVELAISATVPSDSGIYQCVAVNSAGEIWAAGRLQVNASRNSPATPTGLKCYSDSPFKIEISWMPPKSLPSTSITAYTVHYSPAEGGKEEVCPEPGNSTSVEVTKLLEPYTNYSFYVRVWNNHGASDQSEPIVCATAPSVPKSTPRVHVDIISSTKLNVTWKPLTKREARGVIVEYKIQWRLHEHPSSRVITVPVDVENYILTDLLPGSQYDLRVLARTEQGWPNISESQLIWTSVSTPNVDIDELDIKNIIDIHVVILNASSSKIKWEKQSNTNSYAGLKIDGWQVYCENIDGVRILTETLPRNATDYIFTNLHPNVSYTLGLCAENKGVTADCVSKTIKSIYHDAENIPMALEAIPLSSSSIQITWTSLHTSSKKFELCYQPVESPTVESKWLLVNGTKVTVNKLKAFTLYQFKVRSFRNDSRQQNQFSESIECYTGEDVPGKPEQVQSFRDGSKIRVAWKKPVHTNGIIRHYFVSYVSDSTESMIWGNVTVPGNQTWAVLPEFTSGGRHYVMIQAATRVGYGKPSDAVLVFTNGIASKSPNLSNERKPPPIPKPDQSLGIMLGVGISIGFIMISLCSIYCRKKWEHSRSLRETTQPLKNRVLLRNGNVCCVDRSSTSVNQQAINATINSNEIELATLCPSSPNSTNPQLDTKGIQANGTVEGKQPLLTSWNNSNEDHMNLHITENPQYEQKRSPTSTRQSDQEGDLDTTELTMMDCTLAGSDTSLNNNLGCISSTPHKIPPITIPVLEPNG
ncbi:immunoglobulin superfamily DCC subclass member 4-like [Diachasmimorpha longicaudata]|uniref:immunoglobulin superfamily DCC subclass member 4-like n=1 Tax=Diachasmimorpha longicaudata TaxID=58733 RepID=UPI0030B8D527